MVHMIVAAVGCRAEVVQKPVVAVGVVADDARVRLADRQTVAAVEAAGRTAMVEVVCSVMAAADTVAAEHSVTCGRTVGQQIAEVRGRCHMVEVVDVMLAAAVE